MKLIRLIITALVLATAVGAGLIIFHKQMAKTKVTDFESCAAAGNPIQESFPEVCRAPDGNTYAKPVN